MDSETTDKTDLHIPSDSEGDPITWDGNKAHLEGILADMDEWGARTGHFVALVENRAVLLSNGNLAVDSMQAVQFLNGAVPDLRATPFSHSDPCPDTETRITNYNTLATASKKAAFTRATSAPPPGSGIVIQPYSVKKEDAKYLTAWAHVIKNAPNGDELIREAKGSGTALVALLKAEAAKATGRDRALVSARFVSLVNAGVARALRVHRALIARESHSLTSAPSIFGAIGWLVG